MGAKGSGRRPRIPSPDGTLTCIQCHVNYPESEEYFYKSKHSYGYPFQATCKKCLQAKAKEKSYRNRINKLRYKMIQEAAEGDEIITCLRCNANAPESSYVEWDTNVYMNGRVVVKGFKYICGICARELNDRIFSQISGSLIEHRKKYKNAKRKNSKNNKA